MLNTAGVNVVIIIPFQQSITGDVKGGRRSKKEVAAFDEVVLTIVLLSLTIVEVAYLRYPLVAHVP